MKERGCMVGCSLPMILVIQPAVPDFVHTPMGINPLYPLPFLGTGVIGALD